MRSRGRSLLLPLLVVCGSLVAGREALATNTYPNYLGASVSFTSIQETSNLGDPELPPAGPPLGTCCWGAPAGVGDLLQFSPLTYSAQASGAGGYDGTGAQLQTLITATGIGATIDQIYLSEYGDAALSGPTGTGGTGVLASMAGFVTVLEVSGVAVTPTVISFNAAGPNPFGVTGAFSDPALGAGTFALPGNAGLTSWSGLVSIDLASIVPNATKVQLSFDNDLYAYSEAEGNSALITKTSIIIGVVPEPGTFALLGGGLLVLALRARARRE